MSWLPDWLTGFDAENARRAEEADARLRALNTQKANVYGPEWLARVDADYSAQGTISRADQRAAIQDAFVEGATEGLAATQAKFKGALEKIGLGMLGFIPWWAWILAALWLAWKAGALDWMRRKLTPP